MVMRFRAYKWLQSLVTRGKRRCMFIAPFLAFADSEKAKHSVSVRFHYRLYTILQDGPVSFIFWLAVFKHISLGIPKIHVWCLVAQHLWHMLAIHMVEQFIQTDKLYLFRHDRVYPVFDDRPAAIN